MFDHIGIGVADIDASVRFYETALAPLRLTLTSRDESSAGFGRGATTGLWIYRQSGPAKAKVHIAFAAPDRETVARFHAAGMKAGGRDNGEPGLRSEYSPSYYAAFLLDPDGNNIEAVVGG